VRRAPPLADRFAFHASRTGESLELGIAVQKVVSCYFTSPDGSSVEIGSP
jgi:hypothetical protein